MFPSAQDVGQIRARILHTLQYGLEFDLTTEQSKDLLKRHVNSNTMIVVLFVDINGFDSNEYDLAASQICYNIQLFSQESRLAIKGHGGYVLKYVGDSVIGIFPAEFDKKKACENALNCAKSILSIVRECINPALKENNLPHIRLKLGLDCGLSLVILYGKNMRYSSD